MTDTRGAFAANPELPQGDDLDETRAVLAEAGIGGTPEAAGPLQPDFAVADGSVAPQEPHEAVPAHHEAHEAEELKFGWSYPDSASADDLIIGSDGTGYLYPSDFVHGTNGYH